MAAPRFEDTIDVAPSYEDTEDVGDGSVGGFGGLLTALQNPMKHMESRRDELAQVEGLLRQRDRGEIPAQAPIENFGTTGALPLAASTGGPGMVTARTGGYLEPAAEIIRTAGHRSKVSALANRAPLEKAAGLLRGAYKEYKPYIKGGATAWAAKKLGLLD